MPVRRFALVLSLALVAATAPVLAPTASAQATRPGTFQEPPSAPGQLLVGYDIGASAGERADARSEVRARKLEDVVRGSSGRRAVELVSLPAGADRDVAIRRFERNPNVAYAEPNWIVTHQAEPNDPYYMSGSLWGAYSDATTPANQYGSQAGEVWPTGNTGADVVVGVIDTGVDISHPDLAANIWVNPLEQVDDVDNDGNGYVDDVNGWDFHNGNASVYDAADGDKHGTHVAGTIAAERNNGHGIAGVAPEAKIIPVKFLGPNGGYTSNAIKAVDYLTKLKTKHGLNLVASNNSWGGGGYSQALFDAIQGAGAADILFVAAAGNGGSDKVGDDNDRTPHYPSSYGNSNIIAVASITSSGARSTFSNYGAVSVDLGAPGSGIWSTVPGDTYASYNGTSMATPHVAGGVALAAAKWPDHTATQLRSAVLASVVPTTSMAALTVTSGRLDVSSLGVTVGSETNTAPTALGDSYSTKQGTTLNIASPGVLTNDSDAQPGVLTAVKMTDPANGTVTLAPEGGFTYTPLSSFSGTDRFTYVANDGDLSSLSATVTITVTATKAKGGGGGGGKPSGKGNSTK